MEIKLSLEEQNKLKEVFRENLPRLEELDKAISDMEKYYIKEFQEQDSELRDILVNDENIKEEDLGRVYSEELSKIKSEILLEAEESFRDIQEHFISLHKN